MGIGRAMRFLALRTVGGGEERRDMLESSKRRVRRAREVDDGGVEGVVEGRWRRRRRRRRGRGEYDVAIDNVVGLNLEYGFEGSRRLMACDNC